MIHKGCDFSDAILLELRALLRASAFTNLLIARLLRLEIVVDRLKKEIEVGEIVQPVCPPRSNVIKSRSGHSCLKRQPTLSLETLITKYSQVL